MLGRLHGRRWKPRPWDGQIQPAHLLCAILKFAEMDGADLERLGQTNENLGNPAQEHQDLKAHL